MRSGILKYCQVYLYKIMVSKMNPLFKIFMVDELRQKAGEQNE